MKYVVLPLVAVVLVAGCGGDGLSRDPGAADKDYQRQFVEALDSHHVTVDRVQRVALMNCVDGAPSPTSWTLRATLDLGAAPAAVAAALGDGLKVTAGGGGWRVQQGTEGNIGWEGSVQPATGSGGSVLGIVRAVDVSDDEPAGGWARKC